MAPLAKRLEGGAAALQDEPRLEAVCREHDVRLLVLYGSRATNRPPPGPKSDLDLAAWMPGTSAYACYRDLYPALSKVCEGYTVDLAPLHSADPLFRYEVMREGRRLFGSVDDFLEYQAYAYRDYVDSADLRALEDVLFRKKMARIREALYAED